MDIIRKAGVCAVNSVIAELRANGGKISCHHGTDALGEPVFLYKLLQSPENYDAPDTH